MATRKPPRRFRKSRFANSVAPNTWLDSTQAEVAWDRSRGAATRWAVAGVLLGLLVGLVLFAPAQWLAGMVASVTGQRVLLADARGTIWSGSAQVVLTGGVESRDASALPGRMEWSLGVQAGKLAIRARHDCCLNGTVTLLVSPGIGQFSATLLPQPGWVGQWPSALLSGLGTPWNTLRLGGTLRLLSPGMTMQFVQGRWLLDGRADIELMDASSRLSTLATLGSYRVSISGDRSQPSQPPQLTLVTLSGALQLSGAGTITPSGVRFRGEARAADADAPALTNLLNIIGRRDGARSVISIG
jgi:general secretion pathway protein N